MLYDSHGNIPLILSLDVGGRPVTWLPWQDAVCLYVRDQIAWTAGDKEFRIRGGFNQLSREQTSIEINSIIAVRGAKAGMHENLTPMLSNRELFRRDQHTCLYCGDHLRTSLLTRDHVNPISLGGSDTWDNVVTACKTCNQRKGGKTPEQASMPLLALPYAPSRIEYLILANRRILADQMAFLKQHAPKHRRRN